MKAIILAGGQGQRLRSVVNEVPKPMAKVAGRPFLEYLIRQLVNARIREIIISIGYKGYAIKRYFGNGSDWGAKIRYSPEASPLGTAGALKRAARLIKENRFFVMNGDSFFDLSFGKMISFHKRKKANATICLNKVQDTKRYGKVEINNTGEIISFKEKVSQGSGLINTGIYLIERAVLQNIPKGRVSLENDILPQYVHHGLYGIVERGFFIDIGLPKDYLALCKNTKSLTSKLIFK